MSAIEATVDEKAEQERQRELELAAVEVNKDDVDLIVKELEVPKDVLPQCLEATVRRSDPLARVVGRGPPASHSQGRRRRGAPGHGERLGPRGLPPEGALACVLARNALGVEQTRAGATAGASVDAAALA